MSAYRFVGSKGDFEIENPQHYSGLYFPAVNDAGMISSITPTLGGDCKTDQDSFLLSPVSIEDLHCDKSVRNFWCIVKSKGVWSAAGASALGEASRFDENDDEVKLSAGLLWHKLIRRSRVYGIEAQILSFAPANEDTVELMQVTLRNTKDTQISITPVAAIAMYGRSADNIRNHRHVTTLLNRIRTTRFGVELKPTLTFDERGHRSGNTTYGIYAAVEEGVPPAGFYPLVMDFIGEGGSLFWPRAVAANDVEYHQAGFHAEGLEAFGGIRFDQITLEPGETRSYQIVLSIDTSPEPYLSKSNVKKIFEKTREFWHGRVSLYTHTGDSEFDKWLRWVGIQPVLRRICGCSFMPHHDYGRGGRGWRDLWQDCLALSLIEPEQIRSMLLNHFGGVRIDGSNANIIGKNPGEFIADRNNIARVWMDHGVWPFMTMQLYLNQTGDYSLLLEKQCYFKDRLSHRGDRIEENYHDEGENILLSKDGTAYCGTLLEHLLVQHVTAFFDVGTHGYIRLRGADWNDALDMARENGESVAFTAAYAGNLEALAQCIETMQSTMKIDGVNICTELSWLLQRERVLCTPEEKRTALSEYCLRCGLTVSGQTVLRNCSELAALLRRMAESIRHSIRRNEWVGDGKGHNWFNSYYDNACEKVEGVKNGRVRMMLTGQVFTIMSGTAEPEQIRQIIRAADKYLFDGTRGGYRLNTNFGTDIPQLGRMFGFAYGNKENGSVFSHMAVMYAYSLYSRGFALEGYKAIRALFKQSINFDISRIYPAIPEYFDARGRGMYNYLTGSASWYLLTVQTQVFGVKGSVGDLLLEPKLAQEQFDEGGNAAISTIFGGRHLDIVYHNANRKEYGSYTVSQAALHGRTYIGAGSAVTIPRGDITQLDSDGSHIITVTLV